MSNALSDLFLSLLRWLEADADSLSLEGLAGIISITTFLVGFSTIRLQTKLEEWRAETSRVVDRLLEQNAGDDLLPLPGSTMHFKSTLNMFDPSDEMWKWTAWATWTNFGASTVFLGIYWVREEFSSSHLTLLILQGIHLIVVILGARAPRAVSNKATKERSRQPGAIYQKLAWTLETWHRKSNKGPGKNDQAAKNVIEQCNLLNDVLPDWPWLHLLRATVDPKQFRESSKPQIQRIREIASRNRDIDDYSLVAYVWATYLIDADAALYVKHRELQRIKAFSVRQNLESGKTGEIFAEIALAVALISHSEDAAVSQS